MCSCPVWYAFRDCSVSTLTLSDGTTIAGGNVFRDLGVPNPDDMGRKSDLVHRIDKIVLERGMSQTLAAQTMGVDQSDLSKILRGQFRSVTFDKLFDMLSALGEDVMIIVHTPPESEERRGRVMVAFG